MMSPDELVLHLTPPPGLVPKDYPPWRDQVYRVCLAVMAGAFMLRAVALETRSFGLGDGALALMAAATLMAAYFFLVWVERYRTLV